MGNGRREVRERAQVGARVATRVGARDVAGRVENRSRAEKRYKTDAADELYNC